MFRSPEQRTAKSGKPYVMATIKAKEGEAVQWWRITAFAESVQSELMRLTEGDALSVQGAMKCELYSKDGGEPKLSLSIIADCVIPLRQRERPAREVANAIP
jgi:single-stranded DNA-binding protein